MYSVGIDAHHRLYAVCILDPGGKVVKENTIRGGVGEVAAFLRGLDAPARVCYEASLGYGTLYEALAPIASEVQVAHPAHLRAIFRAKRKNDRLDARKLAVALHLDQVPRVHVPAADVREWRALIEHRRRLVDRRTAAKNGLRALLRSLGVVMPRGAKLWFGPGRAWLQSFCLLSRLATLRRDQLLEELERLDGAIEAAEEMLDGIGRGHAGVQLLMTIPGVGPRTAEAVVAYVDQPARFACTRRAGSYFGLVPSLDESAGVKRYGHITRQGPATARKMLAEAAWQVIRYSPSMRALFDRVRHGRKNRTGIALVAVAHRLVRVMVAMLQSGEPWRKEKKEGSTMSHAA